MSLETAPPEVKLAVDLIELLETNQLAPELVLAALAIVKQDYERKLAEGKDLLIRSCPLSRFSSPSLPAQTFHRVVTHCGPITSSHRAIRAELKRVSDSPPLTPACSASSTGATLGHWVRAS